MTDAEQHWRDRLAEWALPARILDAVEESPWTYPVEEFVRWARWYAEHPVGASYARAVEALATPGSVLDVGCGAGAASLALAGTGRVTEVVGVDTGAEMLDALRAAATVPTTTVLGRWPDVAPTTPGADVVVCHHVFYNVPDLGAFAVALGNHARRRVVVELTERHPMAVLSPLWTQLQGLDRPDGPTAGDAVAVLRAEGIEPRQERWDDPHPEPELTYEEVEATRFRLCLPPDRHDDVAEALRRNPLPRLARVTLWWDVEQL